MKRKRMYDNYKLKYSEKECPICLEEIKTENRTVTVPCMHEFCLHCIGKWLMETSSRLCPLCKQIVKKIMYSIEDIDRFSIIGFPTDFCAGWTIRNKMMSVLDDFENVLRKIFGFIKRLFEIDRTYVDEKMLTYLVWFANVKIRIKSRKTADEVKITSSITENSDLLSIKDLLNDRLNMLFKSNIATKIINNIYIKQCDTVNSVADIMLFLEDFIDPEKLNILKIEMQSHLLLNQTGRSSLFLEYYIPLHHNGSEAILFTDNRPVEDKLVAALITKMLCSFNFIFEEDRIFVAHVNLIHAFCSTVELCSSYEKLLIFVSEATHLILNNDAFYKNARLYNKKKTQSIVLSNKAYQLVKHCFNPDDFKTISQSLNDFEKLYIYIEPVLVDDSSNEDVDDCDHHSSVSSDNVEITNVYVEISDSDDDALQIISVNQPDVEFIGNYGTEDFVPARKRTRKENAEFLNSTFELSAISLDVLTHEDPQPSTSNIDMSTEIILAEEPIILTGTDSVVSDCIIEEPVQSDRLNIDFIYQPCSTEDFYQYLLAEKNVNE